MAVALLVACMSLMAGSVLMLVATVQLRLEAHREAQAVQRAARREIARLNRKVNKQAEIIIRQSEEIDDLRDVRSFIEEVRSLPTT